VTGGCRNIHKKEPHNLHPSSGDIYDEMKKGEVGEARLKHGRDKKCIQNFSRETWKLTDHL